MDTRESPPVPLPESGPPDRMLLGLGRLFLVLSAAAVLMLVAALLDHRLGLW